MEMCATVLVRLPNKPSLLVKDSKFRQSRVLAQNAVANLALQKLAQDDPELKEQLDQLAKEIEERKAAALADANAPPPPPPPSRYTTEPHHFHWSSGGAPRARRHPYPQSSHYPGFHHQMQPQPNPYYAPAPSLHFYQAAGPFMPHPMQPNRSTSAPELIPPNEIVTEGYPSYDASLMTPSGYYHPMDFGSYPQTTESTPSTDAGAAVASEDPSPHPMATAPQWPPQWNAAPYYPIPQPPSPHHFYGPGMIQPPPDYHYFQYMQPDDTMMMYGSAVPCAVPLQEMNPTDNDGEDSRPDSNQKTTTALCH